MTSLNICHVFTTFLPASSGGVEHHIISLSKYLSLLGHTSLLIIPRYRCKLSLLPKMENLENLKVFRVGLLSPPYINNNSAHPLRFVRSFLEPTLNKFDCLLGAYIWVRRNMNFSLIHVHTGDSALDLGFRLSKWSKRPFIVTVHQRFGCKSGDLNADYQKYKKIFKAAKKIIVHRNSTRHVLERWGLGHKTIFIPMFIDVEKYRKPDDFRSSHEGSIRILSVGRLERRRDPLTLLQAFLNVHRRYPDLELHMVGDGPLKKPATALIKRYGLEKNVFLFGQQLDVRMHLWQSEIYISINIADNYPSLALREAMAAGLAPVVTDVGETRELIQDGVNGVLVAPSDPFAVSSAITTLIEDETLRKKLSLNAKLSSKSFDVEKYIQSFIKVYRGAIRG